MPYRCSCARISFPCGFSRTGLPVGLQLLGRPFAEETLLLIGDTYERRTGWYEHWTAIPAVTR
jgi:aspartyl-tRNA(Asn)/glutamyl-tRNA(Gln) amidotransferase subunit A